MKRFLLALALLAALPASCTSNSNPAPAVGGNDGGSCQAPDVSPECTSCLSAQCASQSAAAASDCSTVISCYCACNVGDTCCVQACGFAVTPACVSDAENLAACALKSCASVCTVTVGGTCTPDAGASDAGSNDAGAPDASDAAPQSDAGDAAPPADAGLAPSCDGLAATCGAAGNDDCCATLPVTSGSFTRSASGATWDGPPATISAFHLDKYEVTVGRFRQFVNTGGATQASPPTAGAGANPNTPGSGWDPSFNSGLPATTGALVTAMTSCQGNTNTWADDGGANDDLPIDCTTWPIAFAFCAWDQGYLPTEAEWAYAATGGSEQREFAWPADAGGFDGSSIDPSFATYGCSDGGLCVTVVGSHPNGVGKWGQLDLSGNVHEWTLDYYHSTPPAPCTDCADLDAAASSGLTFHGGSFSDVPSNLAAWTRFYTFNAQGAETPAANIGFRCARP